MLNCQLLLPPQARQQLKLITSFITLVHRGGFEPPYLLRGTDLQSVGFNRSPTCANPKTPPGRAKNITDTAQHFSARETKCENSRLTPTLAGNTLMECFKAAPLARVAAQTSSVSGILFFWSWRRESNPRPSHYKSDALPTELRQQVEASPYGRITSLIPEVRDNYLSYHKGNSRATGSRLKCRCSKIMSPHNCNDKMSPIQGW